jgi:ABC-type transport system substrate-binding protein
VEHRPDRHIKLARFKEYSARSEPANGFGGKRTAYFDEILFLTVPETAVRLAGVETGEYHHAMFIKQDSYERIKSVPTLESRVVKPRGWAVAVMNHKSPLMSQTKLRQAFQAAASARATSTGWIPASSSRSSRGTPPRAPSSTTSTTRTRPAACSRRRGTPDRRSAG